MGKRRKQKHLTEDEVERLKAACETFSDQLIDPRRLEFSDRKSMMMWCVDASASMLRDSSRSVT